MNAAKGHLAQSICTVKKKKEKRLNRSAALYSILKQPDAYLSPVKVTLESCYILWKLWDAHMKQQGGEEGWDIHLWASNIHLYICCSPVDAVICLSLPFWLCLLPVIYSSSKSDFG